MKRNNLRQLCVAVSGALLMGMGANAMADSTDDIINALIAKGVLTEEEGALLMKGRTGEKEAAEAKKKTAVSAKYKDGIVLESGDGKNSLAVNGRVHFDSRGYDYNNDDDNAASANPARGADTFDIRRARIGAKYKFGEYYSGEIVFNGTGNAPVLDVGYLNIAWWKPVQFRVGQFKMPFSLEQLTSSNNIDFIERSFVDAYIPAKEIGAMVHGSAIKGTTYGLALSTGSGQNGVESDVAVDSKDIIGRVTANLAEIMDNKNMVLHGGLAYAKGDVSKRDGEAAFGEDRRTEGRGVGFFDAPDVGVVNGVSNAIDRSRLGMEAAAAYGPVKLQAQWMKAGYDYKANATQSVDEDINAWYAQALWTITGESWADRYKEGAFGALKPKNEFDPVSFKGGAWEVGARYSKFDASDFTKPAAGLTGVGAGFAKADTWTMGIKFVPNNHIRFMLDYLTTDFNDAVGGTTGILVNGDRETKEKALIFRTQLTF